MCIFYHSQSSSKFNLLLTFFKKMCVLKKMYEILKINLCIRDEVFQSINYNGVVPQQRLLTFFLNKTADF